VVRLVLAFGGLLLLSGCGGDQPPAPVASAVPIQPGLLLPAKAVGTLYTTPHREDGIVLSGNHAGKRWVKWVEPDGTLRLSAAHGMFRDDGRLKVDGNQVCSTWDHIDKGQTACMRLTEVAPDTYVAVDSDGAQVSRFQVTTPGDPPGPLE
jgi:hypothetical protein